MVRFAPIESSSMALRGKEKLFICYRRADSAAVAGRFRDRLTEEFPGSVFRDVDSIEGGEHFAALIKETIASCGIVLVLIGERWLSILKERSLRRTTDHVVTEITTALLHKVRILPVLLEQASIPDANSLPNEICELTAFNSVTVRDATFEQDFQTLLSAIAKAIERLPQSVVRSQLKPWFLLFATIVALQIATNALGSVRVWSVVTLVALIPSASVVLSFLKPVPPRFGVGMTLLYHLGAFVTLLLVLEFKSSTPLEFSQQAIYFSVLIISWIGLNAAFVARINKKTVLATIAARGKSL